MGSAMVFEVGIVKKDHKQQEFHHSEGFRTSSSRHMRMEQAAETIERLGAGRPIPTSFRHKHGGFDVYDCDSKCSLSPFWNHLDMF